MYSMKKIFLVIPVLLGLVLLVGCGNQNKQIEKVVADVFSYNHGEYEDSKDETNSYYFEQKQSNTSVWEDENNYYILLEKNYESDEPSLSPIQVGFQVGKTSKSISSSSKIEKICKEFKSSNTPKIYSTENIKLNIK